MSLDCRREMREPRGTSTTWRKHANSTHGERRRDSNLQAWRFDVTVLPCALPHLWTKYIKFNLDWMPSVLSSISCEQFKQTMINILSLCSQVCLCKHAFQSPNIKYHRLVSHWIAISSSSCDRVLEIPFSEDNRESQSLRQLWNFQDDATR